jgi:hypothetical protein
MKRSIFSTMFFLVAVNVFAQLDLPRVSPKSTITQNFGYTTITIEYHRPNVKGRKIWGELIPFDKVYRMGANDATTFEFSTDVSINGNKIPAGKYSFFAIPSQKDWTIILNKASKQWGAYNYDEKQDFLRFKVKPTESNYTESLSFWYSDLNIGSVQINFAWEKYGFSFKVESDVMNMSYNKIKDAINKAKPDDWKTYIGSASFAADNNWFLDEALTWADKSIELGANFYAQYVKAKILFKKGNFKETVEAITRTKEKGKDDKNYSNYSTEIDRLEADAKARL